MQGEGLEAEFECQYPGATSHVWGLNGEYLLAKQFPPDMTRTPASEDSPARLIMPATPQYNNTVVQCGVLSEENNNVEEQSKNASLQVQGGYKNTV